MAPCRSRENPKSRRDSGEARAPARQPHIAVSQRQSREAPAPNRGQLPGKSGFRPMTNPYGRRDSGEVLGQIAAQEAGNAA